MKRSTFDFNKELIFGEVGAMICAPLSAFIASKFTNTTDIISSIAVAGSILGACIFWIAMRISDQKKRHMLSKNKFIKDIELFTPVAFVLTLLIYYPSLFLISKYLLTQGNKVISSVIGSQLIAFATFLAAINIYRIILIKLYNKEL